MLEQPTLHHFRDYCSQVVSLTSDLGVEAHLTSFHIKSLLEVDGTRKKQDTPGMLLQFLLLRHNQDNFKGPLSFLVNFVLTPPHWGSHR